MWNFRLLIVLGLFKCIPGFDSQQTTIYSSRTLEFNCIPDEVDLRISENDKIGITGHKFDEYSQGDLSIKLIKGLRRKSKSYYESVISDVIMALCDVEVAKERCVPSNSAMAAKDWSGKCLESADFNCQTGYCETTSNCYWSPVLEGQNRTTRFPINDYDVAKAKLMNLGTNSYLTGLVTFSIIGCALGVLSAIVWAVFFISRYCCCCLWTSCKVCYLCSPIPRNDGYRVFKQWIVPSFVYLIGLIGVVLCGCIAFIGNEDLNASATATFAYLSTLMEDLGTFLSNACIPLKAISDIVDDAANDAFAIFNDTSYVKSSARKVVTMFSDFMSLHVSGLDLAGSSEIFGDAQSSFSSQVFPTVDGIQTMLDALENDLYNNVDVIHSSLDVAISQITSFQDQSLSWQNDVQSYEAIELEYRPYRLMSILGVFVTSTVFVILGFFGIAMSRRDCCRTMQNLMDISSVMNAFLGSIIIVIASASTFVSFAWYDVCEVTSIVTSDFEPVLGETIATGVNAIFNDTNLAEAFNITNKLDFEERLNDGLKVLETVNITESFNMVIGPLKDIQEDAEMITSTALEELNKLTKTKYSGCEFDDTYSKESILKPWEANESKTNTTWKTLINGDFSDYQREGGENTTQYFKRIYEVSGLCKKDSISCCFDDDCNRNENDGCNKGDDCVFSNDCNTIGVAIYNIAVPAYMNAFDTEMKLAADLGVICPSELSDSTPLTCPTENFINMNNEQTLVSLVRDYQSNITNTATDLVNIATNSVGDAMVEIRKFLCKMNLSFIAARYNQVQNQVCGTMLGGFAQINFSLWILAILLELNAVLACILSTRLRGVSKREAIEMEEGIDSLRGSLRSSMKYGDSFRSSIPSKSSVHSNIRSSTASSMTKDENYV